jgi:4-hydroxy-tetrahydrodipicolinate synthase
MIDLHGAFTALITPFTEDGDAVDFKRLAGNVNAQSLAGVRGVVPCGTTGETPTLSEGEYRRVIETTIDAARPLGLTVIAGAGSNNTAHAVTLHRFVHAAGADAALHVTPYYNKPSQKGLYWHFMTIADACGLPVVLYNIPGRTGVALNIDTIQRLAAHPNIIAVKEATGSLDLTWQITHSTELAVLSGDDPLTLPLAVFGARGVISVLSNLLPDRVASMSDAFLGGDWEQARTINDTLMPLARALLTLDTNPVPIKTAMKLAGRDTGTLRPPLQPPDDDAIDALRQLLGAYDLETIEVSA